MENSAIEAVDASGLGLRVEFVWRGDRFGHVVSLGRGGVWRPLWESVEGAAADAWPASPPLQTLHVETLAGGRTAALLLGMAGQSHWSASIELTASAARLIFDVACRHSAAPGWLGSRYRWLAGSEGQQPISIEADLGSVVRAGEFVAIEPVRSSSAAGTVRWRYALVGAG